MTDFNFEGRDGLVKNVIDTIVGLGDGIEHVQRSQAV